MHLTLLTAQPVVDSLTHRLAAAWKRGAEGAGGTVHHFDATALRFDLVLRGPHITTADDEPDLAAVRRAVERSSHVTWLFPTWWAQPPAAMKGLIDRLLLAGWAFRYEGGPLPRGLMAGKRTRWATTMDSPAPWYWLWQHDTMGGSLANGTLRYCGFSPVERTVVYQARRLKPEQQLDWERRFERLGADDAKAARSLAGRAAQQLPVAPA